VGKTGSCNSTVTHSKVHPHVCGENTGWCTPAPTRTGTPPRVWGKRYIMTDRYISDRYTPTCVGKTNRTYARSYQHQVHPHVCGENVIPLPGYTASIGTPPRVWGKRLELSLKINNKRYTPTCVGKTMFLSGTLFR